MKRNAILLTCVLVVFLLTSPAPVVAGDDAKDPSGKDYRVINDRFNATIGGYLADLKTEASVGVAGLFGTFLRLEDDLAIEQYQTTFRLQGFWRIGATGKNAITFGYVGINRSGASRLEEAFEFNGKEYEAGAEVQSELDVATFALGYRYSFVKTGRTEAGITAGLSTYAFGIDLQGQVRLVGETTEEFVAGGATEDILAPIPTVGMFINYGITPKLILRLHAAFLNLDIEDYSGRVTDSGFAIDYYFIKNFGIGFGTSITDIQLDKLGEDPWSVGYRQSGFLFYLTGVF